MAQTIGFERPSCLIRMSSAWRRVPKIAHVIHSARHTDVVYASYTFGAFVSDTSHTPHYTCECNAAMINTCAHNVAMAAAR